MIPHSHRSRSQFNRRSPGALSCALILFAMTFFGWLVYNSPEFYAAQLLLPPVAMICTAAMVVSLFRHGHH